MYIFNNNIAQRATIRAVLAEHLSLFHGEQILGNKGCELTIISSTTYESTGAFGIAQRFIKQDLNALIIHHP